MTTLNYPLGEFVGTRFGAKVIIEDLGKGTSLRRRSPLKAPRVDRIGEVVGCKRIVTHAGWQGTSSLWRWECVNNTGAEGVARYNAIKNNPQCRRCAVSSKVIGTVVGCKKIIGTQHKEGRMVYSWQCTIFGDESRGVAGLHEMRRTPRCKRCRHKEEAAPFPPDLPRQPIARAGRLSNGKQLWKYRCTSCGSKGVSTKKTLLSRTPCRVCRRSLKVGDVINDRIILSLEEGGHNPKWLCQCRRCKRRKVLTTSTIQQCNCVCRKVPTVELGGQVLFIADMAKLSGVHESTIRGRLKQGWSPLEVILGKRKE